MEKTEALLPVAELVSLSVELVSAYVSNNSVPTSDLPRLLSEIHGVLQGMNATAAPLEAAPPEVKPVPAVSVKKSVTPEFIVCLEDGKSFKSLKRHLQTKYGLTPQQYRAKWNLPADYPMVAPNYAAARSAFARASGLGRVRSSTVTPSAAAMPAPVVTLDATADTPTKGRGRRKPKAAATAATVSQEPSAKPAGRRGRKSAKPQSGVAPKRVKSANSSK